MIVMYRGFMGLTDIDSSFGQSKLLHYSRIILLFLTVVLILEGEKQKVYRIDLMIYVYIIFFSVIFFSYEKLSVYSLATNLTNTLWLFAFILGRKMNSRDQDISQVVQIFLYITVLPLVITAYYFYFTSNILARNITNDALFNVTVYFPLTLIPTTKGKIKYPLRFAIILLAVLSFKRSSIIAILLAYAGYLLFSRNSKKTKRVFITITLLAVIISTTFLNRSILPFYLDHLLNRFSSMAKDDGSGRVYIYQTLAKSFQDANLGKILLGHGYQATIEKVNMLAHNDVLQLLYDFGLIIALLYVVIISKFLLHGLKLWVNRSLLLPSFLATIIMFLVLTMFNCFIYSFSLLTPLMFSFGLLYEQNYKTR